MSRWSGIYTDSLRPIKRERILHSVITELCHCSNPKGLSYPGLQYIGNEWGYAPESVEHAVQKLCEMDYVRCHLTNDELGSGKRLVYQVNPSFLYIREALLDECLALWELGKHYDVIRAEMKNIQPDMDPSAKTDEYPKTKTDEYPSEQPQRTSFEEGKHKGKVKTENRAPRNMSPLTTNNGKAVNQATAIQQFETIANGVTHGEAEHKNKIPPPLRVPPPFELPLDDRHDEELAKELAGLGNGTKRSRAREIVWTYNNRPLIRKAIEMSVNAKRSRIGYVIRALENGWVKCDPIEDDPRRYLIDHTGQFLDPKYETPENVAWRDSLDWSAK